MQARKKILLFGTLVSFAFVAAVILFSLARSGPSYQGKSLAEWLQDFDVATKQSQTDEAKIAIREMGASAVPHLVRELQSQDSKLKLWARSLSQHQTLFRFAFTPASARRKRAHGAFHEVASVAQSAVLDLITALSNKDADVRMRAANCLASVAYAADAKVAIPALTRALKDPAMMVRRNAADALRHMKTPATKQAVPLLLELLSSEDDLQVRGAVAMAFGQMRPVTPETVTGLTRALRDDAQSIRSLAAQALGDIGTEAREAVPELLRLTKEDNDWIQRMAIDALKKINADVPARATTQR